MITSTLLCVAILGQNAGVTKLQTIEPIKVVSLAGAPSSSRFAVGQENFAIRIMDAKLGKTIFTLTGHPQQPKALCFNPSGTMLVSGDETARIWVWDAKSGKKLREFPRNATTHTRGIQSITFSSDGKTLYTTAGDDVVIIWDFATAKIKSKVAGAGMIFASANMGISGLIVATQTKGVMRYNKSSFAPLGSLGGHSGLGVNDLATNAAGTLAITGGRDNKVTLWDCKTGKAFGTLGSHFDWVQRVAATAGGTLFASSSNDRAVQVYRRAGMKLAGKLLNQSAVGSPLAFTGDGKYLLTANDFESLQINGVK